MRINKSFIVSVDFSEDGERGVLIVGKQTGRKIDIKNAFVDKEAWILYQRLVGEKE